MHWKTKMTFNLSIVVKYFLFWRFFCHFVVNWLFRFYYLLSTILLLHISIFVAVKKQKNKRFLPTRLVHCCGRCRGKKVLNGMVCLRIHTIIVYNSACKYFHIVSKRLTGWHVELDEGNERRCHFFPIHCWHFSTPSRLLFPYILTLDLYCTLVTI